MDIMTNGQKTASAVSADMTKRDEIIRKVGELYSTKYHCCEAMVLAVSEYFGFSDELLLKISTPFGGGMTGNGAVCGSLIAAYLCISIFRGRTSESESRAGACEPADRIYQKFCEKYGSCNCADIVGYDKKDPKAVEIHGTRVKNEVCIPLTKVVTQWVLEELDQQKQD